MRLNLLIILALATFLPFQKVAAYDVLVLQSSGNPAYTEVLNGFSSAHGNSQRLIVLSEYAEVDIARILREDRPRVVLAVGDAAVSVSRKIKNLPVVAVMALAIHNLKHAQSNLTGISMFIEPRQYISMFKGMNARRVGVIYNAARSNWYLQLAKQAADAAGIELITREVTAPRETIPQIATLASNVDVLWMLPDATAVTRETVEAYFRFGQNNNVPVVSFSDYFLKKGAAVVLEIDHGALGRQAGTITAKILAEDAVKLLPFSYPSGVSIKTNSAALKQLGMKPL